ncbi:MULTISPECIES: YdcH family protein [Bartonella]
MVMATEAHLESLERKHQQLESEIDKAMASPSADDLAINELKRKKLALKDEIEKLKNL